MTRSNILSSENHNDEDSKIENLSKNKSDIIDNINLISKNNISTDYTYKHQYVLTNVIIAIILHALAIWGLVIMSLGGLKTESFLYTLLLVFISCEGVTIGAHRYYTHKSFKAKPFLRAILIIAHTIAGQNSMYVWVRDHRLHHRYSDTDADPHNAKRGFFFCHMGWLMAKKHPLVKELGKTIDMSDLKGDWMVMFQKKYYIPLYLFFAILIPVWIPVYFFDEKLSTAILCCYVLRYLFLLHGTWLVNSAAHLYGLRPYDKNLQPVESWFVSFISFGEGWHNYHHTFPWDYKAAELSTLFNLSADIIKFFEKVGLAWDLKTASPEMVAKRVIRTGDGTHYVLGNEDAKSEVTAIGPLHPLNPTYTSTLKSPNATLELQGLPLFHETDVIPITPRDNSK